MRVISVDQVHQFRTITRCCAQQDSIVWLVQHSLQSVRMLPSLQLEPRVKLNALSVKQDTIALRELPGKTIVLRVPIVLKGLKLQSLAQKVSTSR
jgi:hypothetical protein